MRLRDILAVFSQYSKDIALVESGITNDSNNRRVEGISRFRIAIQQIENTGAFKSEIEDIKNINRTIFITHDDSVALSKDISSRLNSLSIKLQNKLNIATAVLSAVLPVQDQNSISIKLPKINDLKDTAYISEKLGKIFDQLLVNDFIQGETRLQNFDTGSEWLEVVFNSAKAASVVVSVVYSVIYLHREYIKNKEALEVIRNRRISNDIYENLSKQLLDENGRLLEEQAAKIAFEAGAEKNNQEYISRVKFCINELNVLIDKGLKFFPSSTSPSEIKNKLPDFSKNNIEEMLPEIKKLPEKTLKSVTTEENKP
ncbi:hypothetical protein [Candidatus Electronema sp. JM]|uniref:hypothetical protein n=1 Tax=Candidatus Electronema sp. JM TaxID=3401571 RepID=UPI003AA7BCCD